jgi:hypothetical protein
MPSIRSASSSITAAPRLVSDRSRFATKPFTSGAGSDADDETNHDEKLCKTTKRQGRSSNGSASRHGHLSNSAAGVLNELFDPRLRRAVLGHLSRDCTARAGSGNCAIDSSPGALDALEVICVSQR